MRSLLACWLLLVGMAIGKPNVILVFIDDMGWSDFSCFGNTEGKTPNIDRLAKEGIAFEQFYVNSPICSPSRTAISTGQYPVRWGITSYLAHRADNEKRGVSNWLDPKAPMLARALKEAGYATGHFGKWHMGGQRDVDNAPAITSYGFDKSLTNFEGMGPKLLPLVTTPEKKTPEKIWGDAERLGEGFRWMMRSEITGGFSDAALDFIKDAEKDGKPFYVNVWPDDVHTPLFPTVDRWKPNKRKRYLAVLEEMDAQFAGLFDYISSSETLKENTLILICSDNGPEPGAGKADGFRGSKGMLYEGGIRSPLIAWGPGLLEKGAVGKRNSSSVFSAIDLAPSILAVAGVEDPAKRDGENLAPVLLGKSEDSRKAPIFWCRPPDRKDFSGQKNLPDLAVREGPWKLVCDNDGSRGELYNLAEDKGETTNVIEAHQDVADAMKEKVVAWWQTVKDHPDTTVK